MLKAVATMTLVLLAAPAEIKWWAIAFVSATAALSLAVARVRRQ